MPRYCITHEGKLGDWEEPKEDCLIVYAPPPKDFDLDGWEWTMSLPVPSDEELIEMDMNAEVLEADFEK